MNLSMQKSPRPAGSMTCIKVIALLIFLSGCDQPIDDVLQIELSTAHIELGEQDELRHNWPIRNNIITVAKPPPLAYLTSFDQLISVPPLESPDPSVWQNDKLSSAAQSILRTLFEPFSLQVAWTGEISSADYAGPQAYDLSMDGKRIVTVKGNSFALYETANGKRIGSRSFEGDWAMDPPTAIRFAPTSMDFLIASAKKVCRFSSKDGSMVGMIEGPGESIKKWIVADDESFMVMLTESGRLYSGDADLNRLEPMTFPDADASVRFDDFGISFDGVRVSVMVDNLPRTYLQEGGRIVDFISYKGVVLNAPVAIGCGQRDDLWTSGRTLFSTIAISGPNSNLAFNASASTNQKIAAAPQRNAEAFDLFWKPAFLQPVRLSPSETGEWCLAISQRPLDGKWQWVVHDLNPFSQMNSVALPIDSAPLRFSVGRWASHLVVADHHSIRMATWDPWRLRNLGIAEERVHELFNQGQFQDLEQAFETLRESDRWTAIGSSQDVLGNFLADCSSTWLNLLENQRKQGDEFPQTSRESLDRLDTWFKQGGFWAKTIHAQLLFNQSWRAREGRDGLANRGQRYVELRSKALEEMKRLLDDERPIAMTMAVYLGCRMEDEEPQALDSLCRRAVELFPRSQKTPLQVGYKLLPQWYGEPGDYMSLVNGHARLFEAPYSAILYLQTIVNAAQNLKALPQNWNTLDVRLLNRGIDEYIRLGMDAKLLTSCIAIYKMLGIEEQRIDVMRRYYLAQVATLPKDYTLFPGVQLHSERIHWDQILNETRDP